MKFIPILFSTPMVQAIIEGRKTMTRRKIKLYKADEHPLRQTSQWMQENNTCPYGKVGDVLWVREAFVPDYFDDHSCGYKADWNNVAAELMPEPKWKPSLFMPKAACRIFLEITEIRVERLNDITREDAVKEGIECNGINKPIVYRNYLSDGAKFLHSTNGIRFTPIDSFKSLWQSINGKDSWKANTWVWVISFKRIDKSEGF